MRVLASSIVSTVLASSFTREFTCEYSRVHLRVFASSLASTRECTREYSRVNARESPLACGQGITRVWPRHHSRVAKASLACTRTRSHSALASDFACTASFSHSFVKLRLYGTVSMHVVQCQNEMYQYLIKGCHVNLKQCDDMPVFVHQYICTDVSS